MSCMFKTASFVIKHQYTNITYAREEKINKGPASMDVSAMPCMSSVFIGED